MTSRRRILPIKDYIDSLPFNKGAFFMPYHAYYVVFLGLKHYNEDMILPAYVREQTEKLAERYKPSDLKKISSAISEAYANNKGDDSRLITTDEQAAVYAAVRMPATYAAVYSALKAIADGESFSSMLDVGAGTGAAFFAAHEVTGVSGATLVEREKSMISVARTFCKAGGLEAVIIKSDATTFDPDGKYDLVTVSYALNEMNAEAREKLLDKLFAATNRLLLVVESGTPKAFALQKETRSYLARKGARLVAPCPDGAVCSLPGDDWCHFTCRVERSRLHKFVKGGDAPYEDEKFTYSAFCTDGSLKACKARVLRHPITEKGKITLAVCDGKSMSPLTLRKGDDGYKEARKLGAGDAFDIPPDRSD